jgi:uncharacterized protein DUF3127
MSNQVTGRIIKMLPLQTGVGRNGAWVKQDFVIETTEQYPKKVCLSTWGDKASNMDSYHPGEVVKVSFNPESREYNDKWFTELKVWKIEREGEQQQKPTDPVKESPKKPQVADPSDDLPF